MANQAPGASIIVAFARATLYLPLFLLLLSPTYSKGCFLKLALIIFSHTRWMILSQAQSFNSQMTRLLSSRRARSPTPQIYPTYVLQSNGLYINFDKSSFVPIQVYHDLAISLASTLSGSVSSFPQTYLGLPLSTSKLKISAFHPLIYKEDKRLAGWRRSLLSIDRRAILLCVALRAVPTHPMSALLLPINTIQAFDKLFLDRSGPR